MDAGVHVALPAAAWGEKDGTVTNSERRISRQRAFLPRPGEAMPDWWIVSQVAGRMGFADAFAYRSAGDVFREHAALSAFENDGSRDFDLGGLADLSDDAIRRARSDAMAGAPRRTACAAAVLCPRRLLHARPQGTVRRAQAAGSEGCAQRAIPVSPQHGARARSVAHHDPERHEPTPLGALPRAVRRGSSGRRPGGWPHRRRLRRGGDAPRRDRAPGDVRLRPARRVAVRADPLERHNGIHRARVRPCRAGDRSVLRPAGSQGNAGLDRGGLLSLSRLRW